MASRQQYFTATVYQLFAFPICQPVLLGKRDAGDGNKVPQKCTLCANIDVGNPPCMPSTSDVKRQDSPVGYQRWGNVIRPIGYDYLFQPIYPRVGYR